MTFTAFYQRVDAWIDRPLAVKVIFLLSAISLALILPDAFFVYFRKTGPILKDVPISPTTTAFEPASSYLSIFNQSTLFGNGASEVSGAAQLVSISELVKDYRLKGTIQMGEPEAIIEDAKTQKTLFVKAGEPLGDLTVKEVKEGVVILATSGGEISLKIQ